MSVLEFFSVAVLTAQSVSQCVCRGEVSGQLEWVLLDAQFALLQVLIQQGECQAKPGMEKQSLVAKRCQALTALIRLTSIANSQELMDMQERVRTGFLCSPNIDCCVLECPV